jgi:hypothetical protein
MFGGLFFVLTLMNGIASSTYAPTVLVLQSKSLMHGPSHQQDDSIIDRSTTFDLLSKIAGGWGLLKSNSTIKTKQTTLPIRDLLKQPDLVVTIVVEGEYTNVNPTHLTGEVVANYKLLETTKSAIDMEVITAVAAKESPFPTKNVIVSSVKRQKGSTLDINTPSVVQKRGTGEDVVLRMSKVIQGSKTLGTTTLLVPLSSNSHSYVALDVGRLEDRQFLNELDLLTSSATCIVGDTATTNVIASVTTLLPLSMSQKWDIKTSSLFSTKIVQTIMSSLSSTDSCSVITVVVSGIAPPPYQKNQQQQERNMTDGRRRLLEDVNAPGASPPESNRYYTQSEINQYQIKVGASVVFAIALLLSVCLFCGSTMDYKTDNMLFGQINFKNHME